MRENDAWFGHGSLRWRERGGLTSVHPRTAQVAGSVKLAASDAAAKCRARAKYKDPLSLAYGAGLRATEVISRKVSDIRVEQGKGRKDRCVMLSPHLLELLRAWWRDHHL